MFRLSALAGGGVEIGQAVLMEDDQPIDLSFYGRRYLRSGNVETNQANFDSSIFNNVLIGSLTDRTSGFSTSAINDSAHGNSTHVIAGVAGKISTSTDGITWTVRTPPEATDINAIDYGAGVFVIGLANGNIYSSIDGISWTARTSPFAGGVIDAINFVNNVFIVQGRISSKIRVATSADGESFTLQSQIIASGASSGVAYGNGKYVMVAGTGNAYTSPDAIAWTVNAGLGATSAAGVAFGAGVFVTCGTSGQIYSSYDGLSWVSQTSGTTAVLRDVFYNGVFVVVGANERIITSYSGDDGWTTISSGATKSYNASHIANGKFVAVGASGLVTEADATMFAGEPTAYAEDGKNQYIRIS